MPVKIHYGPPGSYKTAGAMGDDFLREAKEGRVIVTNVRGVTRERVLNEFPDLPDSFDVINVSDKTEEGRKKWATWFHWVPKGAFIFVDEIQDIWPKSWRQSDLDALAYPGGVEAAAADDRPKDWEQAFDKHRHWNWDMVLTTPSYKKVRDDIKGVADMAYKHKNLALIGWSGRYVEAAHAADDTGQNQNDFYSINTKKVPSYVFKLYDSTATGKFSDTKSGLSLLKNPRVLLLLGILGVAFAVISRNGVPKVLGGSGGATVPAAVSVDKGASKADIVPPGQDGSIRSDRNGFEPIRAVSSDLGPFAAEDAYISSSVKFSKGWRYSVRLKNYDFTSNDLTDMGFYLHPMGPCGVTIIKGDFKRFLVCEGQQVSRSSPDFSKEFKASEVTESKPVSRPPAPVQSASAGSPPAQTQDGPRPKVPDDSPWRFKG